MTKPLYDNDFEKLVLKSEKPVLVDFWAEWCGPCRMLGPIIDEYSKEASSIEVYKMNVDENPQTPSEIGIRGIPTLMLYKDGKVIGTKVGLVQKKQLAEWVDSLI